MRTVVYVKFLFLLVLPVLLLTGGCKKKKETGQKEVLWAKVRGEHWVAYEAKVIISKSPNLHLYIDATSNDSHIQLDIDNYSGVGKYNVIAGSNGAKFIGTVEGMGYNTYVATSGEIEVTDSYLAGSSNTGIKGKFKFLAAAVDVTEGEFNINLNLD